MMLRTGAQRLIQRVPIGAVGSRRLHQEKLTKLPKSVEELRESFPFVIKVNVECKYDLLFLLVCEVCSACNGI